MTWLSAFRQNSQADDHAQNDGAEQGWTTAGPLSAMLSAGLNPPSRLVLHPSPSGARA